MTKIIVSNIISNVLIKRISKGHIFISKEHLSLEKKKDFVKCFQVDRTCALLYHQASTGIATLDRDNSPRSSP